MSSKIIPAKSARIAVTKKPDLSPSTILTRLPAYRVTSVLGMTVWEFWKLGCKESVGFRGAMKDREIKKQIALITIFRDKPSEFQLSYYPADGEVQVVKNLPISELSTAVDDLVAAGFGPSPAVAEKRMHEIPKLALDNQASQVQILPAGPVSL